ncbi:hypothetical protein UPYG_G00041330 [Umbra pygmaea]|uniref:Secretory calcium-binding phosphoprotein 9 n=1 Tax=Umbra pygmaea TaxID=75934 RepID=A0ABD0Y8U6_UMBPY
MKLLLFVAFMAAIFNINAGKKLRLLTGLNGGVVTGLNPGLMVGGLNPGLMVGGLNPGLMVGGLNPGLMVGGLNPGLLNGGGGFIGQPQFGQMIPGVPTYVMPQAGPAGPFGIPNVGMGQPQPFPIFPGQYQYPGPQPNGVPYYMGSPQMAGMNPPQQQFTGVQGANGNPMMQQQQPQGPPQADAVRRFRRFLMRAKLLTPTLNPEIQTPTETTPSPSTCKNNIQV